MLGLYIHIPFCTVLCTYCDFVKEIAKPEKKSTYVDALIYELKLFTKYYKQFDTIYIGGGTPSSLSDDDLTKLLGAIQNEIDIKHVKEYTIECNPNDLTIKKAMIFKKYGINRVSLGVQTFNEKQLKFLNRLHTNEHVFNTVNMLKAVGITNISVDLIFSLINQTIDEVLEDITQVVKLDINHISYYSLILEERTRLHHLVSIGKVKMNENDLEGLMYETIIDKLTEHGYTHYEVSNYAKDNHESLHNKIYWLNHDYIGIGAGAHGKIHEERYYNISSVKKYIETVKDHKRPIDTIYPYEGLRDEMLMGLRLLKGIHVPTVNDKYAIDLFNRYPKLTDFIEQGYLQLKSEYLSFTRKGLLLGNHIFEIF
ncbi:radical SAM family heme chaperone HemW [Liberiplasma polymorphum]|uniref:radical SAM family heme chaperone HemW n=1 Tax=Liberiplasma polymorphum TaxID=3374570 RepID=UPI003771698E